MRQVNWLGLMATMLLAEIAMGQGGRGYTYRNYFLEMKEYNRKTTVEAYERVGRKNPKWDKEALELLEVFTKAFTFKAAHALYIDPEDRNAQGFSTQVERARVLVKAGCDDPLVMYCCYQSFKFAKQEVEASAAIRVVRATMDQTQYPAPRKLSMLQRYLEQFPGAPDVAQCRNRMRELAAEAARGPFFSAAHRRYVLQSSIREDVWDQSAETEQDAFLEKLAQDPGADPWIVQILRGEWHIKLAWKSRGTGWAKDVTPRGWKGFQDNLALAAAALTAAHRMHPDHPEAATAMIAVAMGAGEGQEQWFKMAIGAQIDYEPAYSKMVYAISPRWGGSFEQMLQIGYSVRHARRLHNSNI